MISKESANFIIRLCIAAFVVWFPVIILNWKEEWMVVYEVRSKSTITVFGQIVFYFWLTSLFLSVLVSLRNINFIK